MAAHRSFEHICRICDTDTDAFGDESFADDAASNRVTSPAVMTASRCGGGVGALVVFANRKEKCHHLEVVHNRRLNKAVKNKGGRALIPCPREGCLQQFPRGSLRHVQQ